MATRASRARRERLDRFMARANAMYYASHDPFADFTTGPEISQVFGEILGLWAVVVWQSMGSPSPVVLAEAGPGRGTLMADALRAIRSAAPAFAAALSVHLVETSPRLRDMQARAVPDAAWHANVAGLPDGPLILFANEFLDALPVRQFVRRGSRWAERYVEAGTPVDVPAEPPNSVLTKAACVDGSVFEVSEEAVAFVAWLGKRLAGQGGSGLIVDYGPEESAAGESLQAIRGMAPANPFRDPGSADLTAHVDFPMLAAVARSRGALVHGPVPQGVFLTQLGLYQRIDRLAWGQAPEKGMALIAAAQRLAEPNQMGRLFKALALCHPDVPPPPGFQQ